MPFGREARKVHELAVASTAVGAMLQIERLFPATAFVEAARRLEREEISMVDIAGLQVGLELAAELTSGAKMTGPNASRTSS